MKVAKKVLKENNYKFTQGMHFFVLAHPSSGIITIWYVYSAVMALVAVTTDCIKMRKGDLIDVTRLMMIVDNKQQQQPTTDQLKSLTWLGRH